MARGRPKLRLEIDRDIISKLRQKLRHPRSFKEKEQIQVVLMASSGQHTHEEIAAVVGRARSTVQLWIKGFEAEGMSWFDPKARLPRGKATAMRDPGLQKEFEQGLKQGRWVTAVEIQRWLAQEHNLKRSLNSIYYWLGKLKGALKAPRPVHIKKDAAAAEAFKGRFYEKLIELGIKTDKRVRVWVADEARYGLHSVRRRCWGLRGHRVVKPAQQKYEWGYVYGALDVVSGGAEFCYLPSVNLELSLEFLNQIADSDPEATHVVIWDQAGFHQRNGDEEIPERVHLLALPAYSPELNPIEKLWDKMKDALCNRVFETLDQIEKAIDESLRPYWESPKPSRSLVGSGWMHSGANVS